MRANRSGNGRNHRHQDDAHNDQLEVLLHGRNAAKEVPKQREQRGPRDATQHVEDHEVAPMHAAHAGDEGHKRADEREEAAQEDG